MSHQFVCELGAKTKLKSEQPYKNVLGVLAFNLDLGVDMRFIVTNIRTLNPKISASSSILKNSLGWVTSRGVTFYGSVQKIDMISILEYKCGCSQCILQSSESVLSDTTLQWSSKIILFKSI